MGCFLGTHSLHIRNIGRQLVMTPDITDKDKIREAAQLLYTALLMDEPLVLNVYNDVSPTYFGLTLKAIAESK